MTSLLSQLQCRIYSTDDVSLLIMTLVDGLKCLAKVPLQFMEDDSFKNDSTTSLNQAVSLESILGWLFSYKCRTLSDHMVVTVNTMMEANKYMYITSHFIVFVYYTSYFM